MSHVVMQVAAHRTIEEAQRCEGLLQSLVDAFVRFEKDDPSPWRKDRVPPPLVAFGERHGVAWPADAASRFLVKGLFADEIHLLRVDRVVFFWAGGFDLGGDTLRGILVQNGATSVAGDVCHLTIQSAHPAERVAELATFLDENDFEDQYAVAAEPSDDDLDGSLFAITVVGADGARHSLLFDDSGVEDWAFASLLPQLDGEDPALATTD